MILKPTPTIPSNYITDAARANGSRYLYVTSDGNPANTQVRLSDGVSLGLVQKMTYTLGLGDLARCTVETLATPGEVSALMENTTVVVRLQDNPLKTLWIYYTTRARRWFKSLHS